MEEPLITDDDLDLSSPRRTKLGVALLVIGLQVLLALALVRAFTPDFADKVVKSVVATFSVTVTTPPLPDPPPPPPKAPEPAGKSGNEGKRAVPRAAVALPTKLPISKVPAPKASSTGSANTSGAGIKGNGTGAAGPGNGTGSGTGGNGQGGGVAAKAVKTAGDINSARDYPIATRDLRINDFVIVAITVGTDGRPTGCRVSRPSKDAQANSITCQLALKRFRFKPASDSGGKPITSIYGWKQSWYY